VRKITSSTEGNVHLIAEKRANVVLTSVIIIPSLATKTDCFTTQCPLAPKNVYPRIREL
jgi:hypothetical protein